MSNNQAIGQDDPNEEQKKEREKEIKELEKKIGERESLIREHETRLIGLRSNGLQLGNIYLVFQGVILTATASGAKVFTCDGSWLLVTISVLAACPNLAALYLIGHEYIGTISQRDKCLVYCDELNTKLSRLINASPQPNPAAGTPPPEQTPTTGGTPQRGETSGPQPDPAARTPPPEQTHTAGGTPQQRGETSAAGDDDYWINLKRIVVLFGCMAFFMGVSAIMVFACRKILCRAVADCKLPSSLRKNCIRFCDEGRSKCLTICRN